MILKNLRIQNFQCHKRLLIEFDSRITTIIGKSDAGKSAIIRALYFLCYNQPSGTYFIRKDANGCSVTLETYDGEQCHKIKRRRSKTINEYVVDGVKLVSFKTSVPEQVAKILNLNKASFQLQHDPPFWFSASAGEVTRELNNLVDLDLLDKTLSVLNADYRKTQTKRSVYEQEFADAKEKISELAWIREAEKDLSKILKLRQAADAVTRTLFSINKLISNANAIRKQLDSISKLVIELKADYERLVELDNEYKQISEKVEACNNVVTKISTINEQLRKLELQISSVKKDLICPLCKRPL